MQYITEIWDKLMWSYGGAAVTWWLLVPGYVAMIGAIFCTLYETSTYRF